MVQSSLIALRETRPMMFPFPPWYNLDVQCEFHDGVVGHSIEECKVFKEEVQDRINKRQLNFDGPNVVNGPLP